MNKYQEMKDEIHNEINEMKQTVITEIKDSKSKIKWSIFLLIF